MDSNEKIEFIARYMPIILQLNNKQTAEKIADVWIEMLHRSTWDSIDDAAFKEGIAGKNLVSHVNCTTESALAVSKIITKYHGIVFDEDRLIAMGLLHDVDKMIGYEMDDNGEIIISEMGDKIQHGVMTAILAYNAGFSTDLLHLILTHTPTQNMKPIYPEGILFGHIDICDWELVVKFFKR